MLDRSEIANSDKGVATERPRLTHVQLRLIAYAIGAAGLAVASLLAWVTS